MIDNLSIMQRRMIASNNDRQRNQMVKDKQKSFQRALLYSYQAAWVKKDGEDAWVRALINPDKVKFDYDEKIISIDYAYGFTSGTTFEWPRGSHEHWIILKQEQTEIAYFRGNVRRCQLIEAEDPETKEQVRIWAAIRGPVETKINTIQKAGIVADVPNLTLDIYMPLTDQNKRLFERYKRFHFMDRYWMVQAPDSISTPGILEITAEEDYKCDHEDLLVEVVDPNMEMEPDEYQIIGDTFVKPLVPITFTVQSGIKSDWTITLPAEKNKELKDVLEWEINDDESIVVTWTAMTSGSYVLHYGLLEKTVVVESLF